jgi:hypothetical protein
MAELTLSELKEQKRPFAEVREFNFNVRLKSQNDHLNQRWLVLGSFAAHFGLLWNIPKRHVMLTSPKQRSTELKLHTRSERGNWTTGVFRITNSSWNSQHNFVRKLEMLRSI